MARSKRVLLAAIRSQQPSGASTMHDLSPRFIRVGDFELALGLPIGQPPPSAATVRSR